MAEPVPVPAPEPVPVQEERQRRKTVSRGRPRQEAETVSRPTPPLAQPPPGPVAAPTAAKETGLTDDMPMPPAQIVTADRPILSYAMPPGVVLTTQGPRPAISGKVLASVAADTLPLLWLRKAGSMSPAEIAVNAAIDLAIPFGGRLVSSGLRTISRGARVIKEGRVVAGAIEAVKAGQTGERVAVEMGGAMGRAAIKVDAAETRYATTLARASQAAEAATAAEARVAESWVSKAAPDTLDATAKEWLKTASDEATDARKTAQALGRKVETTGAAYRTAVEDAAAIAKRGLGEGGVGRDTPQLLESLDRLGEHAIENTRRVVQGAIDGAPDVTDAIQTVDRAIAAARTAGSQGVGPAASGITDVAQRATMVSRGQAIARAMDQLGKVAAERGKVLAKRLAETRAELESTNPKALGDIRPLQQEAARLHTEIAALRVGDFKALDKAGRELDAIVGQFPGNRGGWTADMRALAASRNDLAAQRRRALAQGFEIEAGEAGTRIGPTSGGGVAVQAPPVRGGTTRAPPGTKLAPSPTGSGIAPVIGLHIAALAPPVVPAGDAPRAELGTDARTKVTTGTGRTEAPAGSPEAAATTAGATKTTTQPANVPSPTEPWAGTAPSTTTTTEPTTEPQPEVIPTTEPDTDFESPRLKRKRGRRQRPVGELDEEPQPEPSPQNVPTPTEPWAGTSGVPTTGTAPKPAAPTPATGTAPTVGAAVTTKATTATAPSVRPQTQTQAAQAAALAPAATLAPSRQGRTPGGPPGFRVRLPNGKVITLPEGQYPRTVEWTQGVVVERVDLLTGEATYRRARRAGRPADTFRILSTSSLRPRRARLPAGIVLQEIAAVGPRDAEVTFRARPFRTRRGGM